MVGICLIKVGKNIFQKKFARIKKTRIFAARFEKSDSSLTILRDHNEVKSDKKIYQQ